MGQDDDGVDSGNCYISDTSINSHAEVLPPEHNHSSVTPHK